MNNEQDKIAELNFKDTDFQMQVRSLIIFPNWSD